MPTNTPTLSAARSSLPAVPSLSTGWKIAISAALIVHLTALFVGPWSVEPSSMLSGYAWRALRPYLEGAYLNHGYHFFAPEPGPSHLIRYELEMPDGTKREGVFPNLAEHQPRLLYHRHFMMSEFINASPPESETEKAYAASYASHLLDEYGAAKVTLTLRRHFIPPPQAIIEGAKLTDARFYEERTLGTFTGGHTLNLVANYFRELGRETVRGWNYFWFNPTDPATLCLIRVLAGTMLFYTHAVWTLDLDEFFGPHSWISPHAAATFHRDGYAWSFLWWIESPALLWTVHLVGLVIFAMFALGFYSRVVAVLSYLLTVAYVNRVPGALFGLDQINALLAMYLMIGPSGARYSLDRWLARRRAGGQLPEVAPSISANIAIRLIQLHMCVIYFFAGTSKLMGPTWWEGTALWGAFANLEYQSLDMLWLVHYPILINIMTQVSLLWELSYCALIWPRLTRPIMLGLAVPLHLGIAICMGMVTFGLVMLFGNMAFISPRLVRLVLERDYRRTGDDDADASAEQSDGAKGRAGEAPRTAAKPTHAKRRDQGGARASMGPR